MAAVGFWIPIKTVSVANAREGWQAKARRVKAEREATAVLMRSALAKAGLRPKDLVPASVTLTRAGAKPLDDDNLRSALKAVRDQVAAELGVDDGSDLVEWFYEQEHGKPRVNVFAGQRAKPAVQTSSPRVKKATPGPEIVTNLLVGRRARRSQISKGKGAPPEIGTKTTAPVSVRRAEDDKAIKELVAASPIESEPARRGLAFDYVVASRALAVLYTRVADETVTSDEIRAITALVSNRRRILEALKLVKEKLKHAALGLDLDDDEPPPPAKPVQTSAPTAHGDADDEDLLADIRGGN